MDGQALSKSSWMDLIFAVKRSLNWMDLIAFVLGALAVALILILVLRRFSKKHTQEIKSVIETYEHDVIKMKEKHIKEIYRAEKSVQLFKSKLEGIEKEHEKSLQKIEKKHEKEMGIAQKAHAKRAIEIEKDLGRASSVAQLSVYELRQKISKLRQEQISKVESFQNEIKELKKEITEIHEGHAKEIESAELKILDLRKQLNLLIYKV